MQFILILAVVGVLTIAEHAPCLPLSGVAWRLLTAGAGVGLVTFFAWVASSFIAGQLQADFTRHRELLRRFRLLRRIHTALWLATAGGIVYGLDWGQLVRFNWHLQHAFLIDELLILVPVVVPLIFAWAAFYEVDRAVRTEMTGQGVSQDPCSTRLRYVIFHMRHYLGTLLVPVLGLVAVQDAVELFAPQLIDNGSEALVFIPALGALLLLFPVLLRYVWKTEALPPGPLRDRLEAAAGRSGFRVREILVWDTGGMILNAAVAGFLRTQRYVFLTDALLARLSDEEVEAVFRHEMAHVRLHHLAFRVMAMVAPLSLWLLLGQIFPDAVDRLEHWLGMAGMGLQAQMGLAALAVMAVYVLVVFGYYSRLLEHQADLFGCRWVAADVPRSPFQTFTSALEKLAISGGFGRNTRSWQHASIARRVDFLEQLSRDPQRELRFQRRVRLLGSLVVGVVISPVMYQLLLG